MALNMGARLGHYEILTQIGRGGMGEVYRGRDLNLDREVAIKVLPAAVAENATRRARFEREARVISQLSHPNICAIYDVGEQDGVAFLVMEYIDGETLEHRLRAGALPWPTALQSGIQIASALAHAHEHGIAHRDLKPANVMLSGSSVKLLDFGIAKLIRDDDRGAETGTISITGDHKFVGTPNYMSPEQLEGRPVDGRADIFALGALLYEMVTGRKAFEGASVASVTAAVIKTEPPPISSVTKEGPIAPEALDHVVRQALAKEPDERWQTAHDLEHELRWVGENPVREPARSRPVALAWRFAVLAAAVLALTIGAWAGWKLGGPLVVPVGAKEITSFTIDAPNGTQFGTGIGKVAVSPRQTAGRASGSASSIHQIRGASPTRREPRAPSGRQTVSPWASLPTKRRSSNV
jgi:serine/threonine protein kinase